MADEEKGRRRSIKNLYSKNEGLPIRINLYVIKYIYYHIKKADRFLVDPKARGKAKAYPIYTNWLPMSRQRVDRINHGDPFELSNREAMDICERFGLNDKYFKGDNAAVFEIEGIETDTDWKCFYLNKYGVDYTMPNEAENDKDCETRRKNVENVLKTLISSDWEKQLNQDDPVYKVCYYFHYGKRSDEPDNKKLLEKVLRNIEFREWESEPIKSLKEYHKLLKGHYDYISSLIMIENLRNGK